tara:strand:- start:94 stop:354 length:261 start_codon:yes stop_codon:yes gene_type:complete
MTKEELKSILREIAEEDRPSKEEVQQHIKQQEEVIFNCESEVADILAGAKSAVRKAKSLGELKRIRKMANEKSRLIVQFNMKEDYL